MVKLRICRRCQRDITQVPFAKRGDKRGDGYRNLCVECNAIEYRELEFKRNYGCTMLDYELLMIAQDGVCAICRMANEGGRMLCIDHCHVIGGIRGLLCGSCNRGLGMFRESPEVLERALEYLRRVPMNLGF